MTPEKLVEIFQRQAMEAAAEDAIKLLSRPPGRSPSPHLVALSKWYLNGSAEDRERIREVSSLSARLAVFGILAILDGVRPIGDAGQGRLELQYLHNGGAVTLNDAASPLLHDMFQERVGMI